MRFYFRRSVDVSRRESLLNQLRRLGVDVVSFWPTKRTEDPSSGYCLYGSVDQLEAALRVLASPDVEEVEE